MINLDDITNENNKEHNEKWPYISHHSSRLLITGGSGSGKTNTLLNLIKEQDDIDKIYLYAKYLSEPKYEFLIQKRENAGIKHLNDPNAFIECSNTSEYLTGEDLDLKPSTVEQTKSKYPAFGKVFNKGLTDEDKKQGLLKGLKDIEK